MKTIKITLLAFIAMFTLLLAEPLNTFSAVNTINTTIVKPGPKYVWVAGHYTYKHGKRVWVPGHWKRVI